MMKKFITFFILLTMLTGVLMAQGRDARHAPAPAIQQGLSELRSTDAAALAGRFMAAERLLATTAHQKSMAATMKLDSITYEDYMLPAKSWELSWRDIYLYDAQNRVNEIIEKEWDDDSNTIVVEGRTTITYNAGGRVSDMHFYYREDDELVMTSRMELFYTSAGRIDSIVDYSQGWEGNEMEMSGYQKYVYDSNGLILHIASYEYDEYEEGYLEIMRRAFTYNAAGQRILSQYIIIDEDEEMIYSQTELFYNAAGRLIATEYSNMNYMSFPLQLEKRSRSEYDYDSDGDQTESRWYDRQGSAWVLEDRDVTSYHATLRSTGVITPFAIMTTLYEVDMNADLNFVKLPLGSTNYVMIEGSERIDSRSLFHYTGLSNTQVEEPPAFAFRIYPNPVGAQLYLDWTTGYDQLTLEVFHITGARVMQQQIIANQAVDTQTLRGGMYLYRVSDQGQVVYSGKFVKQ